MNANSTSKRFKSTSEPVWAGGKIEQKMSIPGCLASTLRGSKNGQNERNFAGVQVLAEIGGREKVENESKIKILKDTIFYFECKQHV